MYRSASCHSKLYSFFLFFFLSATEWCQSSFCLSLKIARVHWNNVHTSSPGLQFSLQLQDDELQLVVLFLFLLVASLPLLRRQLLIHRHHVLDRLRSDCTTLRNVSIQLRTWDICLRMAAMMSLKIKPSPPPFFFPSLNDTRYPQLINTMFAV